MASFQRHRVPVIDVDGIIEDRQRGAQLLRVGVQPGVDVLWLDGDHPPVVAGACLHPIALDGYYLATSP